MGVNRLKRFTDKFAVRWADHAIFQTSNQVFLWLFVCNDDILHMLSLEILSQDISFSQI